MNSIEFRHRVLLFCAVAVVTLTWSLAAISAETAKKSKKDPVAAKLLNSESSPWGKIKRPSKGSSKVIGKASNGCIDGAKPLAKTGKGFVSIRRYRNRYYGHPDTLSLVKGLGERLSKHTSKLMMVGDIAQPRGGEMTSGHRSHQNGLDVDIWFQLADAVNGAGRADPPSMVAKNGLIVNGHWSKYQAFMVKTAAQHPGVDRIFINPAIKRELCNTEQGDRRYLRKIRAWRGHDAHFHVRMKCPNGSPTCQQQPSIAVGDGCKSLAMWFRKKPKKTAQAKPASKKSQDQIQSAQTQWKYKASNKRHAWRADKRKKRSSNSVRYASAKCKALQSKLIRMRCRKGDRRCEKLLDAKGCRDSLPSSKKKWAYKKGKKGARVAAAPKLPPAELLPQCVALLKKSYREMGKLAQK